MTACQLKGENKAKYKVIIKVNFHFVVVANLPQWLKLILAGEITTVAIISPSSAITKGALKGENKAKYKVIIKVNFHFVVVANLPQWLKLILAGEITTVAIISPSSAITKGARTTFRLNYYRVKSRENRLKLFAC